MADRPYSVRFNASGWEPGDDPILIAKDIDVADSELARFRQPLELAAGTIQHDVERAFATETSPDGVRWTDWAPSYKDRAERENISILYKRPRYHRSENEPQLRDAATDPDNYIVLSHSQSGGAYGGGEVGFKTENLPEYWAAHQFGFGNIPARPYLGVSADAEAAIFTIFDAHVERALVGIYRRQPIVYRPGMARPQFASHFLSP